MPELSKHNVICTNVKCVKVWLNLKKRKRKEKRAWLKIIKKQAQRTSKSVQIYFKLLFQANLSNISMPVLKYYICWLAHVTIVQVQQKINNYYRFTQTLQSIFFQMLTSDHHFTQCYCTHMYTWSFIHVFTQQSFCEQVLLVYTTDDVPLVEFMYLVFTCMPGESYCRWLRSLLYLCYAFWVLINSLVCYFTPLMSRILSLQKFFFVQLLDQGCPQVNWLGKSSCLNFHSCCFLSCITMWI